MVLHENNLNYHSYRFTNQFFFILFLSFHTIQEQEPRFEQVVSLVTRNFSLFLFIVSRGLLQSHAEFNRLL